MRCFVAQAPTLALLLSCSSPSCRRDRCDGGASVQVLAKEFQNAVMVNGRTITFATTLQPEEKLNKIAIMGFGGSGMKKCSASTILIFVFLSAPPSFANECMLFDKWSARADAVADSVWISQGNSPRFMTYDADQNDPFLFESSLEVAPGLYEFTAEFHVKETPSPVLFSLENATTREGSYVQVSVSSGVTASVTAPGIQPSEGPRVVLRARAEASFRAQISAAVGRAQLCRID